MTSIISNPRNIFKIFGPHKALLKLPKSIWVLFGAVLVNRIGTMVLPFLTLYLNRQKGLTLKEAGVVFSTYGLAAIFVAPIAGGVSDRFGAIRVMCLSLGLSALMMFLYPLANSMPLIILCTVLLACFNEVFRPIIFTLASEMAPPEHQRQSVVLIRLGANLGMSIGPALGGWLATHSFNSIFFVDGVTTFLAGLFLFIFFYKNSQIEASHLKGYGDSSDRGTVLHNLVTSLKDKTFRTFLLGVVILSLVFFQQECTWPLILVKYLQLSPLVYGKLFTLNTLIIVLLEIPLVARFGHHSSRKLFAIGALLTSVGVCGVSWVSGAASVYMLAVLFTFGEMLVFPIGTSFVASIAPAGKKGAYMGTYTTSFNVSLVLAPLIGTFLLDNYGTHVFSIVLFFVGIVSALIFRTVR